MKDSNCFIYKTETGSEYLIINGLKFEIKSLNPVDNEAFLDYEMLVLGHPTATSTVYYSAKRVVASRGLSRPPNLSEYELSAQKKGPTQLEELPDERESYQQNKKSRQKDNRRQNFGDSFEDSDSD